MKKIMMTKYGFVRWAEEDFSDDGNRFTCYKVGERVRVSKLVADGYAYINARIDGSILPYEVYSGLPHYDALGALNGVPVDTLTDACLFDLVEACRLYEEEYTTAEATIKMPSYEEVLEQSLKIKAKRVAELAEVERLVSKNITAAALWLSAYQWKTVKEYLVSLHHAAAFDAEAHAKSIVGTSTSFHFIKEDYCGLRDSYYYKWLVDVFKSCH